MFYVECYVRDQKFDVYVDLLTVYVTLYEKKFTLYETNLRRVFFVECFT